MNGRWITVGLVLALVALVLGIVFPGRVVYWQSPEKIEQFLLQATPLGQSEESVLRWLNQQNVAAKVRRVEVPPHSNYPRTRTGGASFIHESIAHFWLPFRTDIEVFYTFDRAGRLVEIRVRKTTDAL